MSNQFDSLNISFAWIRLLLTTKYNLEIIRLILPCQNDETDEVESHFGTGCDTFHNLGHCQSGLDWI